MTSSNGKTTITVPDHIVEAAEASERLWREMHRDAPEYEAAELALSTFRFNRLNAVADAKGTSAVDPEVAARVVGLAPDVEITVAAGEDEASLEARVAETRNRLRKTSAACGLQDQILEGLRSRAGYEISQELRPVYVERVEAIIAAAEKLVAELEAEEAFCETFRAACLPRSSIALPRIVWPGGVARDLRYFKKIAGERGYIE